MLCKREYDVLAITFSGIGSPRDLLETGQTQSVLAEAFGMSQSVLSRLWNGYQKLKMLSRSKQCSRRVIIENFDRYLAQTARHNRSVSASLSNQICNSSCSISAPSGWFVYSEIYVLYFINSCPSFCPQKAEKKVIIQGKD